MKNMLFTVGYGSKNRENKIRDIAKEDHIHAVILAAVHCEWMVKRTILKLGNTPTAELRRQLKGVFGDKQYMKSWKQEIEDKYTNSDFETVLGNPAEIKQAFNVRGEIVHGNGTVSRKEAENAIDLFISIGEKLRDFAANNNIDLDSRLKGRRKK